MKGNKHFLDMVSDIHSKLKPYTEQEELDWIDSQINNMSPFYTKEEAHLMKRRAQLQELLRIDQDMEEKSDKAIAKLERIREDKNLEKLDKEANKNMKLFFLTLVFLWENRWGVVAIGSWILFFAYLIFWS